MVNVKTGLIDTVVITDFYYNTNQLAFSGQVMDPDLPEATFVFTPAKGMKVEDNSNYKLKMR